MPKPDSGSTRRRRSVYGPVATIILAELRALSLMPLPRQSARLASPSTVPVRAPLKRDATTRRTMLPAPAHPMPGRHGMAQAIQATAEHFLSAASCSSDAGAPWNAKGSLIGSPRCPLSAVAPHPDVEGDP